MTGIRDLVLFGVERRGWPGRTPGGKLQRPLPDGVLKFVASVEREFRGGTVTTIAAALMDRVQAVVCLMESTATGASMKILIDFLSSPHLDPTRA